MTRASKPLSRRKLLRGAGAAAAGLTLGSRAVAGGRVWEHLVRRNGAPRHLVLLELSGGNDGLATVVPHGDDALYRLRPTTTHQRNALLPLDDYRGFNPKLARVRAAYDAGRLAIVEGCGYPEAIRSHFKSLEVWHTARHAGRVTGDGWIGRLVESAWKEETLPETVVHFGGRAPYSLHSSTHPPVALVSPSGYRWLGDEDVYAMGGSALCEHEEGSSPGGSNGRHAGRDRALRALRATLDDAAESSARVRRAAAAYSTVVQYPKNRLAASLRDVAALIDGALGTRVFSVAMGGFDTHTGQLDRHDRLMEGLDGALGAFLEDLQRSESGRQTVVCVYSEFGRRVAENGSRGHDHGKAAPMLIFGGAVRGGLYGAHPSLEELDEGDLAFTTDFRSVYATLIERWFGAKSEPVLGGAYETLEFLG